ncbi:MAG TPA: sugar isomerase domain-containing protein [Natronosporangium sp.]
MTFLARLRELLAALENQDAALSAAADAMADALAADRLVHLFGSGHSVIPVMEAFPRYGSYAGFHPLLDPRLMWWNVLGPGGVREFHWLEQAEGYVDNFLNHRPIGAGDVMLVFSHGGRNAAPVEAAAHGRRRQATVVAITSSHNLDRPATHSSGQRLAELADIVIDTGVPAADALVDIAGWDYPVAGGSTIVACACTNELIARTASRLAERGVKLPTFVSPTANGAAEDHNDRVFAAHRDRVLRAELRTTPANQLDPH